MSSHILWYVLSAVPTCCKTINDSCACKRGHLTSLGHDLQEQDLEHPPEVTHLKDVEQQQEQQQEPAAV